MKKLLSILISISVALSTCMFAGVANADEDPIVSISFNGTEYNSLIDDALNLVNQNRASNGFAPLVLDQALTSVAKQRAKEIFIYRDNINDSLPNGSAINTYLPNYSITDATAFGRIIAPNAYNIRDILKEVENYAVFQSVGIGVFEMEGGNVCVYGVVSLNPSSAAYTDFNDYYTTATVSTKLSNINPYLSFDVDGKYPRYNVSLYANPINGYASRFVISPNQYVLKSSKSSVLKVKNSCAYPKKNGAFTVTAYFNSNPSATVAVSDYISFFDDVKVRSVSAKSKKKKTVNVKWAYSISDATGYEVQYSTSKKFKKAKKVSVKGTKKTKATIKKLKSKKKYYVRVRGYINQGNGERCYSKWSKTVVVKVK